jgi:hypothetical protein
MKMNEINVREKMVLVADWLGWQDEYLSTGLKSFRDAEKLYDAAMKSEDEEMGEMADLWAPAMFRKVIGYNPFALALKKCNAA